MPGNDEVDFRFLTENSVDIICNVGLDHVIRYISPSLVAAIYDGAPVGLCFLDRNLRYVSINRRLADIEGSSVAFHLGRTLKEIISELYPSIEPYLLRALQGESIQDVEVYPG